MPARQVCGVPATHRRLSAICGPSPPPLRFRAFSIRTTFVDKKLQSPIKSHLAACAAKYMRKLQVMANAAEWYKHGLRSISDSALGLLFLATKAQSSLVFHLNFGHAGYAISGYLSSFDSIKQMYSLDGTFQLTKLPFCCREDADGCCAQENW